MLPNHCCKGKKGDNKKAKKEDKTNISDGTKRGNLEKKREIWRNGLFFPCQKNASLMQGMNENEWPGRE